jgi:pyruvate/2-oxoglutarate dehydrogenase complex dihydrolipoamide acyltransferase (E2) component
VSSSHTEAAGLVEVTMPQMGVSVAEGTVVEWRKRVGDWVQADETICEISTDKIDSEVPAPASGRVTEILVEVGATVPVETLLARIDTAAAPGEPHADEHVAADAGAGAALEAPPRRYSPVVQRIAAEHGIDLDAVHGTGRGGRVRKQDVLAAVEAHAGNGEPPTHIESPYRPESESETAPKTAPAPEPAAAAEGDPRSRMRRAIGEHMLRSLRTAAHCTTIVEADFSAVETGRSTLGLTYLPIVARCVIDALREFPALNATFEGDRLVRHDDVNLGVAVSLGDEDGLIVPVIQAAQLVSAEGLGRRIADLARRARAGELTNDEVAGGTFTITNPGVFGAIAATPIINQPQVAILDLEAVVKRSVVVTDERGADAVAIRPMANLCMSWDHRALDGALAARFLSAVRRNVEGWSGG